jgi:hypothetical protein
MSASKPSILTRQSGAKIEMTSINVSDLAAGDELLIWTDNSFYRYRILDPVAARGCLLRAGQSLTSEDATLLGTTDISGSEVKDGNRQLERGMRMIWLAMRGDELQRLLTSAITRMVLIKAFNRGADEFHAAIWEDDAGLRSLPIYQH